MSNTKISILSLVCKVAFIVRRDTTHAHSLSLAACSWLNDSKISNKELSEQRNEK